MSKRRVDDYATGIRHEDTKTRSEEDLFWGDREISRIKKKGSVDGKKTTLVE